MNIFDNQCVSMRMFKNTKIDWHFHRNYQYFIPIKIMINNYQATLDTKVFGKTNEIIRDLNFSYKIIFYIYRSKCLYITLAFTVRKYEEVKILRSIKTVVSIRRPSLSESRARGKM